MLTDNDLARHVRGHLLSACDDGCDGPKFLRGLLRTARGVLWQVTGLIACLREVLQQWDDDRFVRMLPMLRLALADLTPAETDRVARQVAVELGTASVLAGPVHAASSEEMLRAVDVDQQVRSALAEDGLEAFGE
jgi:hypothetical protein